MNFGVSTVTTYPSTFQQIPRTYLYLLKQSCKRVTAKQQAAEKGILFSDPMTSTQKAHIFFESTMEGACSPNDGHSRGSMTETISWVNLLKASIALISFSVLVCYREISFPWQLVYDRQFDKSRTCWFLEKIRRKLFDFLVCVILLKAIRSKFEIRVLFVEVSIVETEK